MPPIINNIPSDLKLPDKSLTHRGLTLYISDIRAAPNREAEQSRVMKELANIRSKFSLDTLGGKRQLCIAAIQTALTKARVEQKIKYERTDFERVGLDELKAICKDLGCKPSSSGSKLNSYDRRKYVWKLVYTYLLGE